MREVKVRLGTNSYAVHIGSGLLMQTGRQLKENGFTDKLVIITNPIVKGLYGDALKQNLIADGYNVTSVKPIIKTMVDAEGNVVTKATSAVLMLQKDTTGHASVMVDIEEAKVTQIVIITRTVIDKP